MILDQHEDRLKLLETSAKTMFGADPARSLIEPPFHVESHLYQTIQAADWVATFIGRLMVYRASPVEYADWQWAETYFGKIIDGRSTHSKFWTPERVSKQSGSMLVQKTLTTKTTVSVETITAILPGIDAKK